MAKFLRSPEGPSLGALHLFYDAGEYPARGGVRADAYDDLDGFLASGESPSHDDLISLGIGDFLFSFWAGGNPAQIKVGETNADWAGGAGDVLGTPLTQVGHAAIAGSSWIDQWEPALNTAARKGSSYSYLFYGGCVPFASATDNATLDSYSALPELLGAAIGYDIQNPIDYTANPPHRRHVDRLAQRGVKIAGEPWGLAVPSVRGWYARTYASISGAKAAPIDSNDWADLAWANDTGNSGGKAYYLPRSLKAARNKSYISLNATGTVQQRIDAILLWASRGTDRIYVDWGGFAPDEVRRTITRFRQATTLKKNESRQIQVYQNAGNQREAASMFRAIGTMVEPTPEVVIAVGDENANTRRFSIQVVDKQQQKWGGRWLVRFYVTDQEGGDPDAAGNTIAVATGTPDATILAGAMYDARTDATGLIEVDVTVSGAANRYLYAEVTGKPIPSTQAAFT